MAAVTVNNENQIEGKDLESMNKSPKNFDEMVLLYMEMRLNHSIMCSRIEKLENRVKELESHCNYLPGNEVQR